MVWLLSIDPQVRRLPLDFNKSCVHVMSLATLGLIISSVCLSAIAQVVLKAGMSGSAVVSAFARDTPADVALAIMAEPLVWLGLTLYAVGAVVWLFVLAKVNVSLAYPFVGLGFLMTMVFAIAFLGEAITPVRAVGTCLVAGGVLLVALK